QGEIEPEETAKPTRHFSNLFEAPVLFYAACVTAMVTQDTGLAVLTLAWTYVAARLLHTYIHLGGNRVRHRLRAYFAGWLVLVALWIQIVVHLAMRG
ncbi:MAG TPA: MAPEG family protein, partial [Xanthomonadaceae bacterium]|nr:MAPEG family protein [Xanthomonadaceae bacterium]